MSAPRSPLALRREWLRCLRLLELHAHMQEAAELELRGACTALAWALGEIPAAPSRGVRPLPKPPAR